VNSDGRADLVWYHENWSDPNNGGVFVASGTAAGGFDGVRPVLDGLGVAKFATSNR
jgi:hypothetical protein